MLWTFDRNHKKSTISLATKLMALYTLSTLALLGLLGIVMYPSFSSLFAKAPGGDSINITLECYKILIITLLVGTLGALFLGSLIAKKGLSKIQELQENIESISAHALDDRICLEDWPRELKPLGQCFNEMLERLNKSFTQISQFSSDIAHELRHPIHSLKQIAEQELSKSTLDPIYESIFLDYMAELNHLSKLIEQLLFIARSEHNQIPLNKQPWPIQITINKIIEFYQALAAEKNITMRCEGEAVVSIDQSLVQRIISNLIANAIQNTPDGGNVIVKIAPLNTGQTQIAIHDTGRGIEAKHLPHIFDRFYRVDADRSHSGGLGLGLAIVKSIMILHSGDISIQSEPLRGTSVYLRFK